MTKREAVDFLVANVGESICIAYRTDADGTLLHRPEPRTLPRASGSLMALGLAACAAHAPELDHPGAACRDPQGYEVDCEQTRRSDAPQIPDAEQLEPTDPEAVDPNVEMFGDVPDLPAFSSPPSERDLVGQMIPEPVTVAPIQRAAYGGGLTLGGVTVEEIVLEERPITKRAARKAARRERRSR